MVAFYKHQIPDWMDGTESLNDGAYRAYHVICQLIYLNEGPIAFNERGIAGRCNQSPRAFRKHLTELVEVGKVTIENGEISNIRAEKELENVKTNRENARRGGVISGNVRHASAKSLNGYAPAEAPLQDERSLKEKRREDKKELTNVSLSETSSDASEEESRKRRKRVPYSPDFEAFWEAYPTDALMSKKAAADVWSRMAGEEREAVMRSLAAFRAYCASKPDYRPVHACRYLTQERFVGFNEVAAKAAGKVFIAKDTPEWEAWQRVEKTGSAMSQEFRKEGWWFPSRWPAQQREFAA